MGKDQTFLFDISQIKHFNFQFPRDASQTKKLKIVNFFLRVKRPQKEQNDSFVPIRWHAYNNKHSILLPLSLYGFPDL